jgi:hypothetical protein
MITVNSEFYRCPVCGYFFLADKKTDKYCRPECGRMSFLSALNRYPVIKPFDTFIELSHADL